VIHKAGIQDSGLSFFVQPLAGKQEVAQLRGFRESPARERNPNPLSRLFDEFCSSSGSHRVEDSCLSARAGLFSA